MTYLATMSLQYFTGLARDVCTNTFHFNYVSGLPVTEQEYETLGAALMGFYESCYGSATGALTMSPWIDITQTRYTLYDLSDPPPRTPVYEATDTLNVTPASSSSTPMEAAICLSYRGAYTGGINRARQRGRIYLGSFQGSSGITAGGASSFPTVRADTAGVLADAALDLLSAPLSNDWQWVVYSRAGAGATYPIVAGWVDAEVDTQRRRGNVMQGTRYPWTV